jgi:hypothetical protein
MIRSVESERGGGPTNALMRRRWLLYGLLLLNVIVNALVPLVFLLSAFFLVFMSFRTEFRPLFRLYGIAILAGGLLTLAVGAVIHHGFHP